MLQSFFHKNKREEINGIRLYKAYFLYGKAGEKMIGKEQSF